MPRRVISDEKIVHIWEADCDCYLDEHEETTVEVHPDFYQDNGEPSCQYCGRVYNYLKTEIEE